FGDRTTQALWKYLWTRKPAHPGINAVFLGRAGRPLTGHIAHRFARIAKRAGLRRANPQLWRHSSATNMLRLGVPTAVVQRILGHAHITTTELYTHLVPDDIRVAYR